MIRELRILPPLVIARFGGATTPMDNYEAKVDPEHPLAYRRLEPATTFEVNRTTGEITGMFEPPTLQFTQDGLVRPIAPFLELWALTEDDVLEPATLEMLAAEGATAESISWTVEAANLKVFRRTRDALDQVTAKVAAFSDHTPQPLVGTCDHFWPGATIPFGDVQYIKPTPEHPEIRLRITPAAGLVYGSSDTPPGPGRPTDPNLAAVVYNATEGIWRGYTEEGERFQTIPVQLFAGVTEEGSDVQISWGYLDDACDGIVRAALTTDQAMHSASARFATGPPTYVPDAFPIRAVADELEQALRGPHVDSAEPEQVEEIVRRAFESVRLMNTAYLNIAGPGAPVTARSLTDSVALERLHQSLFVALRSGTAPWFSDALREWDQVRDRSETGRKRMPAMMRGADGALMALTRRQVNHVRAQAHGPIFEDPQ
ncbi:MAG: hypothetical protein LC798_05850 [Chloroflexi bacterium]|nr:hypothetical protein [Chloroflexota bacterium]